MVVLVHQDLLGRLSEMEAVLAIQQLIGDDAERGVDDEVLGGDRALVVTDPPPGQYLALCGLVDPLELRVIEERGHVNRVVRLRRIEHLIDLEPLHQAHGGALGPCLVQGLYQVMIDLHRGPLQHRVNSFQEGVGIQAVVC